MKIWFSRHNFFPYVGAATSIWEAQSRNMINICTTKGLDILIISGSYAGHR